MLYHLTLDKHKMLKLSFEKHLDFLVNREVTERDNQRLISRLHQDRLKQQAYMEDIDYQTGRRLDARLTQHTIELFQRRKHVVSHVSSKHKDGFTTLNQHIPEAHQKYSVWSPKRFRQWAEKNRCRNDSGGCHYPDFTTPSPTRLPRLPGNTAVI